MTLHRIALTAITISLLAGGVLAENTVTPGKLDIDPPTLIGLGFQWWIDGDDNGNASLSVEYRQAGQKDWIPGLEPYYQRQGQVGSFGSKFTVQSHFAGSIIDLPADTAYEVRLTLSDPDGVQGRTQRIFQARTRKVPIACPDGRVIEVYPDREGKRLEDVLPTLQAGDVVKLHEGTYNPPAFQAPPSPKSTEGKKVQPGDGRIPIVRKGPSWSPRRVRPKSPLPSSRPGTGR